MFELWKNELQTKEEIKEKLKEIKQQYKEYLKLTNNYNWNKQTVNDNIKQYKKIILSFKKALKDY